jgi:hypothetical protein
MADARCAVGPRRGIGRALTSSRAWKRGCSATVIDWKRERVSHRRKRTGDGVRASALAISLVAGHERVFRKSLRERPACVSPALTIAAPPRAMREREAQEPSGCWAAPAIAPAKKTAPFPESPTKVTWERDELADLLVPISPRPRATTRRRVHRTAAHVP